MLKQNFLLEFINFHNVNSKTGQGEVCSRLFISKLKDRASAQEFIRFQNVNSKNKIFTYTLPAALFLKSSQAKYGSVNYKHEQMVALLYKIDPKKFQSINNGTTYRLLR